GACCPCQASSVGHDAAVDDAGTLPPPGAPLWGTDATAYGLRSCCPAHWPTIGGLYAAGSPGATGATVGTARQGGVHQCLGDLVPSLYRGNADHTAAVRAAPQPWPGSPGDQYRCPGGAGRRSLHAAVPVDLSGLARPAGQDSPPLLHQGRARELYC